jgi:NADH dehydrogenase
MLKTPAKIVIVGAGFAGLSASQKLSHHSGVTVIDPREDFEFQPNIHELVSGSKSPRDLRLSISEILARRNHHHIRDRVKSIDSIHRQITIESGEVIKYDVCIVAIGGVPNDNGVQGADEFADQFKSIDDCYGIAKKLKVLVSKAHPYSVAIVGAGIEGVELLGELLKKGKRDKNLSIVMIEAGPRCLPSGSKKISERIVDHCKGYPVDFMFDLLVEKCEENLLYLNDGSLLSPDLIIWTGGVKSHPLLHAVGLSSEEKASSTVNESLQSHLQGGLFVTGDCIEISGDKEKQAYHAMDMGVLAAENALRYLNGTPLRGYKPKNFPSVISFGDLDCFVEYGKFVLSGLPLSILKESIYQLNMEKISRRDSGFKARCDDPASFLTRALKGLLRSQVSFLSSPRSWCEKGRLKVL